MCFFLRCTLDTTHSQFNGLFPRQTAYMSEVRDALHEILPHFGTKLSALADCLLSSSQSELDNPCASILFHALRLES